MRAPAVLFFILIVGCTEQQEDQPTAYTDPAVGVEAVDATTSRGSAEERSGSKPKATAIYKKVDTSALIREATSLDCLGRDRKACQTRLTKIDTMLQEEGTCRMPDGTYDSCGNGIVTETTKADVLNALRLAGKECLAEDDADTSPPCVDAQNIAMNLQTRYSYCLIRLRLYREDPNTGECRTEETVEP